MEGWIAEARDDYRRRAKIDGPMPPALGVHQEASLAPWTPARIIEQQRETIAMWRQRATSAEKMVDAMRKHGARLQVLYGLARDAIEDVATERDDLATVALMAVDAIDEAIIDLARDADTAARDSQTRSRRVSGEG